MNPRVPSFPALIRWIADKYHGGAVLPIARKVGVSPALVHLWATGNTKNPKIESLERLCDAYGLDFDFVRGLLRRRAPMPISGGSAPLNPLPMTGSSGLQVESELYAVTMRKDRQHYVKLCLDRGRTMARSLRYTYPAVVNGAHCLAA